MICTKRTYIFDGKLTVKVVFLLVFQAQLAYFYSNKDQTSYLMCLMVEMNDVTNRMSVGILAFLGEAENPPSASAVISGLIMLD